MVGNNFTLTISASYVPLGVKVLTRVTQDVNFSTKSYLQGTKSISTNAPKIRYHFRIHNNKNNTMYDHVVMIKGRELPKW